MQEFSLKAAPEVTVALRRSSRARRISLRVSSLDGRVTLTLPQGTSDRAGLAFAEDKARWLQKAIAGISAPVAVAVGQNVPVAGEETTIVAGQGRAARFCDGIIAAPPERAGPAVEALLKAMARDAFAEAVARYSAALGKASGRLTLRDTRSRWGSCSHEGNLMFSWRLVMAPPRVLDYVAAHEVAHLKHMDHSAAFWACVETLFPGHRAERDWLRQHGASLHRFRFRQGD
ncbi:MAG: SprT family zinc-dependent metalloprotease [Pseudomonadota bacterium]